MKFKLSICIPTFNRADFLKELLNSILEQIDPAVVEIAISDNASTDNTEQVVKFFQGKYRNIAYKKWIENRGADKNYIAAVEISSGEYCWLMGSDDVIPNGAINEVLSNILGEDVYLVDRIETNLELEPVNRERWLHSRTSNFVYDFSRPNDAYEYFNSCRRLGGLFSYLSSIVVKRKSWDKYPCADEYIGTLYSHAYVVLSVLMGGGRIKYIPEPLVYSRSGNDSFLTDWVSRGLIDLRGYRKLGFDLIKNDNERKAFFRVMLNEITATNMTKSLGASGWKNWSEYKFIARDTYKVSVYKLMFAELLYPAARMTYLIKKLILKHRSVSSVF